MPLDVSLDTQDSDAIVDRWLRIISAYDNEFRKWERRVEKIINKYRDDYQDTTRDSNLKFNILWSNVQTAMPAVYSRVPKADVSRRFNDTDPVGRVAALLIERSLDFELEHYSDFRETMKNCVLDRFLGGRGVAWVRYEPHIRAKELDQPYEGLELSEDEDYDESFGLQEEIEYECSPVDYVHWHDFGHSQARAWEEVQTVWRKLYLNRAALVERFGEELGKKIPLDSIPDEPKERLYAGTENRAEQALIYEIWDKDSGKVYWISKTLRKLLDVREDPLELEGFFPCPKPLYATLTTDSLIPVPDFTLYQDQATDLDILTTRIDQLIKALQVKGVYDASVPELSRLLTEGTNNQLIPVKNWQSFAEKQGIKGAIDLIDIQPLANALLDCYRAMDQVKSQIYEITGLSDIIRGQSVASETATAQQLKGQYASLRLKAMQTDVSLFAQDLIQKKAQIICQFFQPETILRMSAADQLSDIDKSMIPQALQVLKQDPLRNFRIEVRADSLVQMDEQQEKQDRLEFLKATGAFLQQALPAGQSMPQMVPLLIDMMKFGVTAFKVGKTIEGEFDQMGDQFKQIAQQPKQPPPPDPEMMKVQATAQAKQQELQLKAQLDQQHLQAQMQFEQQKQALQHQQTLAQNQVEAQREALAAQNAMKLEQFNQMMNERLATIHEQIALLIAQKNNEAKIEVAEIGANTELVKAQIDAAQNAQQLHAPNEF